MVATKLPFGADPNNDAYAHLLGYPPHDTKVNTVKASAAARKRRAWIRRKAQS